MAEQDRKATENAASDLSEAAFPHVGMSVMTGEIDKIGVADQTAEAGARIAKQPLGAMCKRSDFLAAARACRQPVGSMLVQARFRNDDDPSVRIGFTCSKKVGNAVARNRAKRRMREIARLTLPEIAQPGWDYVLIGRREATAERPFGALCDDLRYALRKIHAPRDKRPKGPRT